VGWWDMLPAHVLSRGCCSCDAAGVHRQPEDGRDARQGRPVNAAVAVGLVKSCNVALLLRGAVRGEERAQQTNTTAHQCVDIVQGGVSL
jgi:hypothetical protein